MAGKNRPVMTLIIALSLTSICLMGEARAAISYFETPVDFWGYYEAARRQALLPPNDNPQKLDKNAHSAKKADNAAPPLPTTPGNNAPETAKRLLANPTRENAKEFIAWFEEQTTQANKASEIVNQVLAERANPAGSRAAALAPDSYTRGTAQVSLPGQRPMSAPSDTYDQYAPSAAAQHAGYNGDSRANKQLVVYYFFSPRCPYCQQQSPLVERLYREGGYRVLGIAMDSTETEVKQYIHREGFSFPVKMNTGESGIFGIKSYPAIILVTANGKAYRLQGLSTMEEIMDGLRQAGGE